MRHDCFVTVKRINLLFYRSRHSISSGFKKTEGVQIINIQQIGQCISHTIKIGIIVILIVCSIQGVAQSSSSMLKVELIHSQLSLGLFPTQEGQANSNFTFNFARYINPLPEIAYRITNTHSTALKDLELKTILPEGLTRLDYLYSDCPKRFVLYPNQSCLIRFEVDINAYVPTMGDDPKICYESEVCFWPIDEQQLNRAVADAPETTQIQVTPSGQAGLSYDPNTLSLTGKPSSTGSYVFEVVAYNKYVTSAPRDLIVNISIDPKDKPVFKKDFIIPSATPNEEYQLNLMDLIEQNPSFMKSNQLKFAISKSHQHPAWLSIDEIHTVLHGHVPPEEAGKEVELWIIASSNTGGDAYFKMNIPVVFDPAQKPIIKEGIEFSGEIAGWFEENLKWYITDPTKSHDLEIVIDSIKPESSWLQASGTKIKGMIPDDNETLGITYEVRLHAHTKVGGDSVGVTIPISIGINKHLTPYFRTDRSICPNFYAGKSYLCDFVANNAVFPNDIPYAVEFAPDFPIPQWIRLEDNKLIADRVSDEEQFTSIYLVLKNVPGGASKIQQYLIYVQEDGFQMIPVLKHQ